MLAASAQRGVTSAADLVLRGAWQLVGGYADQLYAIRPYTAHVPRAVTAFVNYLRQALAGGFGTGEDLEK